MMEKSKVALVGGGKIGEMICELLTLSGDYDVTVIDGSRERLDHFPNITTKKVRYNVTTAPDLAKHLAGHFAVINACPHQLTKTIAEAAVIADIHYLDLTEDVQSTKFVRELSMTSKKAFIPQCGLAPGFISIVTNSIAEKFHTIDEIRMRVGALPEYPTNSMKYNLTWSSDGLVNEYCNPCEAIIDGKVTTIPGLANLTEFSLDGIQYEAFNTSGGMGSLGETLSDKVKNMSYQTIRYPGHRDIMRTLLHDLRLSERREVFKDILENALPTTGQDVVLIFVTVNGTRRPDGPLFEESYANKIYSMPAYSIHGKARNAIQLTTAAGICVMLDLIRDNHSIMAEGGLVLQEQVSLDDFLGNRFGKCYRKKKPESEFGDLGD